MEYLIIFIQSISYLIGVLFFAGMALIIFLLISFYVFGLDSNKKHNDDVKKRNPAIYYIPVIFIWLIIFGWLVYDNQFEYVTYVYACPDKMSSKCYKVRADYIPEYCDEGYCDRPTIEKIYFENGGYVSFDYCDTNNDKKFTCYAEDGGNGAWEIEKSETVKIKKQLH